ncbi:hypothetical protein FAGAP_6642 [Fusarium agapanthi]|uniref:Uncharacterized protein n=1 Tax=Fusarium agapanthi TaxID=1803897 RepID=A0A9P5EDS2_9HYPO|nr:hypothetical protein FAGAP_6642 [Fusarium agapanthi]
MDNQEKTVDSSSQSEKDNESTTSPKATRPLPILCRGKLFSRAEWDEVFGEYDAVSDVASFFAESLIPAYPDITTCGWLGAVVSVSGKVPDVPFPHVNDSKEYAAREKRLGNKMIKLALRNLIFPCLRPEPITRPDLPGAWRREGVYTKKPSNVLGRMGVV